MADFMEDVLGKGVVYAKDSPNFIGNRILTFASQFILHEMTKDGLSVEEVDALTGPAVGHASSARFARSTWSVSTPMSMCWATWRTIVRTTNAWTHGRAGLAHEDGGKGTSRTEVRLGFYKATDQRDEKGKRVIFGLDLSTLEYRPPIKPRFDCTGKVRMRAASKRS